MLKSGYGGRHPPGKISFAMKSLVVFVLVFIVQTKRSDAACVIEVTDAAEGDKLKASQELFICGMFGFALVSSFKPPQCPFRYRDFWAAAHKGRDRRDSTWRSASAGAW